MLHLQYLAELASRYSNLLDLRVKEFPIGNRFFAWNAQPGIMGVINLSPDSWYRESVCLTLEAAVARGKILEAQGADLVDVGAESTLAHAARVSPQLQTSKLLPVVKTLAAAGTLVSVETYDAGVARACLDAGAHVLNLTGAGTSEIYKLVKDHDAAVILCYVQGENVREAADFRWSSDPVGAMEESFARQIEQAVAAGLDKILIDPGLGFYYRNLQDSATRVRYQMATFLQTFRLRKLGFPVCHALPHAFEYFGEEVRSAECFFAVLAALGQTSLFRTHEVPRIKAVLETMWVGSGGKETLPLN